MNRSTLGVLGVILIVLGIVALIWGGIPYTEREAVLDVGPVEVEAEHRETIPLPPLLGGLALAGGVVLVLASRRTPP